MFPNVGLVKRINSGGQVEIDASLNDEGAEEILFKGSIIPTGIGSNGLTSSLVGAKR